MSSADLLNQEGVWKDTALTFAQPIWLWGLLLVVLLITFRYWSATRSQKGLDQWVIEGKKEEEIGKRSRKGWWSFVCLLLSVVMMFLALARPQKGERQRLLKSEGRSALILMDVSKSMLVEDLKPSRLVRSKLAAEDLLQNLKGEQVGVVAFAGASFLQAPLTVDHLAVRETIQQLDTGTIPRGGTNLSVALSEAVETFERAGITNGAVVLFSDGGELEGEALKIAGKMADSGFPIISIGVGSEVGGMIPDSRSNNRWRPHYVKDDSGKPVMAKLEADILKGIAQASGGLYLSLDANTKPIELVRDILSKMDMEMLGEQTESLPVERYQWLLFFGLMLLFLSRFLMIQLPGFKSSLSGVGVVFFLVNVSFTDVSFGSDQEQVNREEVQLQEALVRESELRMEGEQFWNGFQKDRFDLKEADSAFSRGDFEKASRLYGEQVSSIKNRNDAQFNLANSLFYKGGKTENVEERKKLWDSSIEHYEAVLGRDEEREDVQQNLEYVKKIREQLEQDQKQEEEKKDQEDDKKEEEQDKDEQKEEDKESEEEKKEENDKKDKGGEDDKKEGDSGKEKSDSGDKGDQEQEESEKGKESEKGEGGEQEDPNQDGKSQSGENGEEGDIPEGDIPEGDLEADQKAEDEDGASNGGDKKNDVGGDVGGEVNDKTGYSPNRARALLRQYGGEAPAMPTRDTMPFRREKYKDW